MKSKFLVLITSLLFNAGMKGQNSYLTYHNIIVESENQIAEENFSDALVLLDSAFNSVDWAFTKDYIIAAQLAAIQKDKDACLKYIEKAMEGGYNCDCFKKHYQVNSFLSDNEWEMLASKQADYKKKYLATIDRDLSYEFSRRYREEQNSKMNEQYPIILRSNYDRIISLMDSLVFVSDRVVGIDEKLLDPNKEQGPAGLDDCGAGNSKVIVTLLHSYDPISHFGIDRFQETIRQGHLHPRELASIYSYTGYKGSKAYKWTIPWQETSDHPRPELKLNFMIPEDLSDMSRVNRDRAMIGICSYETDEKIRDVGVKYKMRLRFAYR